MFRGLPCREATQYQPKNARHRAAKVERSGCRRTSGPHTAWTAEPLATERLSGSATAAPAAVA